MEAAPDVRRARCAITAIFALNGALFASAFARLPAIQERTGISEGQLGLALPCCSLAAVLAGAVRAPQPAPATAR